MPATVEGAKLSRVPRRCHKGACGLELFPFKDGPRPVEKTAPSRKASKTSVPSSQVSETKCKRKRASKHPDEPKMTEATTSNANRNANETCFFWYHGHCAGSKEPRRNFQCDHLHALTDPPTMVQPPPNYIHRTVCSLEWCPGDYLKDSSGHEDHGRKKRKTSGGDLRKYQAEVCEQLQYDDVTSSAEDGVEEEWFLSGFS